MPTLAAIITTVGRAALTANDFAPVFIHVGSGALTATNATAALDTPEAIIAATVQAQQVGDDVRLHVVCLDSTTAAYDVREWALVNAGGDFLAVYGGATLVAAKAAGSHLHLALDIVLEGADVGSVTIGDTDYLQPMASETVPGIVELATTGEVAAGTDPARVITVAQLKVVTDLHAKLAGGNAMSGDQQLATGDFKATAGEFVYTAARTKTLLLNPHSAKALTSGWAYVQTLSSGMPTTGYWECSTDSALLAYPLDGLRLTGMQISEIKVNWENTGASGRAGANRLKFSVRSVTQSMASVGSAGAGYNTVGTPAEYDDGGAGSGVLTDTLSVVATISPGVTTSHWLVIKAGAPSNGSNKDRIWGVQLTALDPGPRNI